MDMARSEVRKLAAEVRTRRVSAVIFPEGTRGRRGELGKFRPRGALALLAEAPDVAVLPICIDQSWRLLSRNLMPVPFGITVRVWIGDPIPRHREEKPETILDSVEAAIRTHLRHPRAART